MAREVLSDWDLDDLRHPRGEVMRWTVTGLTRIPVTFEGTAPSLPPP
jgi:hypothetical protein